MITPFMIYLIGICDSLNTLCIVISVFLAIFTIGSTFYYLVMLDDKDKEGDKRRLSLVKRLGISFIICCTLCSFVPSTRLAASMFIIPAIVNNEKIMNIGSNSLEALYKLSEKWLLELKEKEDDKKSSKNL